MKSNWLIILFFIFLEVNVLQLFSQNCSRNSQTLTDRIALQLRLYPKEKIHLHIDRSTYVSGDTLWFSAYLLHSTFHTPFFLSSYLYVELITPFGEVINRVKIKKNERQCFSGYILVPLHAATGNYTLRAYTRFMLTDSMAAIFKREVHILYSPEWNGVDFRTYIIPVKQKKYETRIELYNTVTQSPVPALKGNIELFTGKTISTKNKYSGNISFEFEDQEMMDNRSLLLEVIDSNKKKLRQYIAFSTEEQDYDVTFYPEGGHLLSGDTCKVAFKALDKSGNHTFVSMTLKESTGKILQENIKTVHDGMGAFEFVPQSDTHYLLTACNAKGLRKTFPLSSPKDNASSLKVKDFGKMFRVSIVTARHTPKEDVLLLVHCRGAIIYEGWQKNTTNIVVEIEKSSCPAGTIHCLLLNRELNIISERLFFIPPDRIETVDIQFDTNKDVYMQRECIKVMAYLTDYTHSPLQARLSLAVTDNELNIADTFYPITSTLLLTSELKGRIENPSYYLQNNNNAQFATDLLMLTHGWRKYDFSAIAKGNIEIPSGTPEQSQSLSGRLKFNKPLEANEKGRINIITPDSHQYRVMETDSLGHFVLSNLDFCNGTSISAFGSTMKTMEEIKNTNVAGVGGNFNKSNLRYRSYNEKSLGVELDAEITPEENIKAPQPLSSQKNSQSATYPLINYYRSLQGIYLPETIVNPDYEGITDYKELTKDDIFGLQKNDIWELLKHIGITCNNVFFHSDWNVFYKGNPVKVYIDGTSYPYSILNYISPGNIKSLQVFRTNKYVANAIQGAVPSPEKYKSRSKTMTDAILDIILDSSFDFWQLDTFSQWAQKFSGKRPQSLRIELYPLGFQKEVEFYSPKYEKKTTTEDNDYFIPDFRPTIYWNPELQTNSDGRCAFSFYAGDRSTTYNVVIEGVTNDGKLIHEVKRIKIN